MKLTVGRDFRQNGFALPTILLVSTVMLIILAASVAAVAASRVSLDSQYYNVLAKQAAQSGMARVKECLSASGNQPQWSTEALGKNLRPNSDCTGTTISGAGISPYVVGDGTGPSTNVRTKYSVDAPVGTEAGSLLKVVGTVELVRSSSPNNVWRTYVQSLYYRIDGPIAGPLTCPSGFVPVPGNTLYGTDDFCLAKYESKNVGGLAVSQASGQPYWPQDQSLLFDIAKNSCVDCHVVTEAEWMTVAQNALNVGSNWTGGSVGSGSLYTGRPIMEETVGLAASSDDNDGYYGTGQSSPSVYRRTLTLGNGQVVWDLSGNAEEWTSGQTYGGQPGGSGKAYREWNSVGGTGSLPVNPFPSFGTSAASGWTSTQGIGRLYSDTSDNSFKGSLRGGGGLFALRFANQTWGHFVDVGGIAFRMAIGPNDIPPPPPGCPTNFVTVPGNATFGTDDFCVAKYETKNVDNDPVVQAAGTPYNSIPQYGPYPDTPNATFKARDTCNNCRLLNTAEWLTLAHNIINVGANWSGGSVGSGSLYSGQHATSGSPLAASTNDSDGYYGTGTSSGVKRRTMYLSNGEVVWDVVGNVAEFTLYSNSGPQAGISGGRDPSSYSWSQWSQVNANTGSISPSPFPSFGTPAASAWGSTQRIGALYSKRGDTQNEALVWGGSLSTSATYVGPFSLSLSLRNNTSGGTTTGFRVMMPK